MANEHKGDFLDMFAEWAAAGARPAWQIVKDVVGPAPPEAPWNPNSIYQLKRRAEQEGRQLIPGALPPSAAIPGTGPTGNKVGVDYNPNEPGMQGNPSTWPTGAVLNDPAADQERNRKSEADRMMQQYASDEYWDTEAGKAMMDLGSQESYEGDNLAEFYNAQQAVGTGTLDEIIDDMGYTGNMEIWARANPALALREYQKNSEALPADGYAGTGTGELQPDERLKDILKYSGAYTPPTADKFLQQQVDQLEKREDGPLWGPGPREDGPLWGPGPGDPPPVDQTQEQTPTGFPLPSQADGLSELLQSLGTREILNQIDETGGGLAEQAGEWYGRKKAQEFLGADWPVIGDLIQDEGGRRGAEKGREYWNQYTGPFFQ